MRNIRVGSIVEIPAGTKVTINGLTYKRERPTNVTVRNIEYTRAGNAKVFWKSSGYKASAVLK